MRKEKNTKLTRSQYLNQSRYNAIKRNRRTKSHSTSLNAIRKTRKEKNTYSKSVSKPEPPR